MDTRQEQEASEKKARQSNVRRQGQQREALPGENAMTPAASSVPMVTQREALPQKGALLPDEPAFGPYSGLREALFGLRRRINQKGLVWLCCLLLLISLPFVYFRYRRTVFILDRHSLSLEASQASEYAAPPFRLAINGETWFLGDTQEPAASNEPNELLLSRLSGGQLQPVFTFPLGDRCLRQVVYSESERSFYCRTCRSRYLPEYTGENSILSIHLEPGPGIRNQAYTASSRTVWTQSQLPTLMASGPEGVMVSWEEDGRHYISCLGQEQRTGTAEAAAGYSYPVRRAGGNVFVAYCSGFANGQNGVALIDPAGGLLSKVYDCEKYDELLDILVQNDIAYLLLRSRKKAYGLGILEFSGDQVLSFRIRELPDLYKRADIYYHTLSWDRQTQRLEIGFFTWTDVPNSGRAGVLCLQASTCRRAEICISTKSTAHSQSLFEAETGPDGRRHYYFMDYFGNYDRFTTET